MFKSLGYSAKVENLVLENINVKSTGWNKAAILAEYLDGEINNVKIYSGSVESNNDAGGLCAEAGTNASISDSYSIASVTGNGVVGGFIGINKGAFIKNCYVAGGVKNYKHYVNTVGGFIGENRIFFGSGEKIVNCYFDMNKTKQTKSIGYTDKDSDNKDIDIVGIRLDEKELVLDNLNPTKEVKLITNPECKELNGEWKSSNNEVVKVSQSGGMTLISEGNAEVSYNIPVGSNIMKLDKRVIALNSEIVPEIKGVNDISIKVGAEFNPIYGVTAVDKNDGDLTSSINIDGKVDINTPGVYTLKYSVKNAIGKATTVIRKVTVNPALSVLNEAPVINASNKTLKLYSEFNPLVDVSARDLEDGNITDNIKVVENTVDKNKSGIYNVIYEVTDSQGAKARKSITVTVEKIVKENEATSKLAYVRTYGIILEGLVSGDEKYDDNVKKSLVIKDKDGTVKLKKDILNTNWYGDGYSGFQAIISTKDISDIGKIQGAKLEIEVNNKGNIKNYDFKMPTISDNESNSNKPNGDLLIKPGTDIGWSSEYYDIQNLPKVKLGGNIVQLIVGNSNIVYLSSF